MIDNLYKQTSQAHDDQQVAQQCEQLMQPSIKLSLLGRAFSGRKTVAKQMQDVLGQDVAILHIDEIIKEAIEYISPKKVDESVVVDPKAKGKAKGKADEAVVVDVSLPHDPLHQNIECLGIKSGSLRVESRPA